MSNTIDTSALLSQLRNMAREAGLPPASGVAPTGAAPAGGRVGTADDAVGGRGQADAVAFTDVLRDSLVGVNERSRRARELTEAFERGRPDVELSDVMIAVQKARISFETLTQVRNKMVAAYKDVMSTPL